MAIRTMYSSEKSVEGVISELKKKFELMSMQARMVMFFTTSKLPQEDLAKGLKSLFGDADILGCSTAGEIISGQMLKESVVVMVFDSASISDVKIEVVEGLKQGNNVNHAFESFEEYYKTPMRGLNTNEYVGVILADGMTGAEEGLMERIGDLTNVLFVGASAGDDLQFKATYVIANGRVYENAAVLALIKPTNGFDILKTQSFTKLDKQLLATDVDEASREVIMFNNKPAAKAYAEALGVEEEKANEHFMTNPVGLMIDGDPFVRSPQQIVDGKMKFYCNIKKGMNLSLLESKNIVEDTQAAITKKQQEMPTITGIVNFHCILRTLELENKNQTTAYGNIFKDIPTIGFSTYGEEFIGHINQTSTMLIFK